MGGFYFFLSLSRRLNIKIMTHTDIYLFIIRVKTTWRKLYFYKYNMFATDTMDLRGSRPAKIIIIIISAIRRTLLKSHYSYNIYIGTFISPAFSVRLFLQSLSPSPPPPHTYPPSPPSHPSLEPHFKASYRYQRWISRA